MDNVIDDLWIGDIQDVREGSTKRFDRVITVCQDNVEDNVGCSYNFFCMSDGPTNAYGGDCSYELFYEAAITLLGSLAYGEEVLIHCHMGQSRSVSVAIAAACVLYDDQYDSMYSLFEKRRPQIHPDQHLRKHAEKFIEESHQ